MPQTALATPVRSHDEPECALDSATRSAPTAHGVTHLLGARGPSLDVRTRLSPGEYRASQYQRHGNWGQRVSLTINNWLDTRSSGPLTVIRIAYTTAAAGCLVDGVFQKDDWPYYGVGFPVLSLTRLITVTVVFAPAWALFCNYNDRATLTIQQPWQSAQGKGDGAVDLRLLDFGVFATDSEWNV
ncbi:hypothetical protein H4582DRAFT_2066042 [Lactarius indigo]|nr:hypothetical protein H4582DRAFT_2066042 [Lactarius indigo]